VFPTPPSAQRHLFIPCAFLHQGAAWGAVGGWRWAESHSIGRRGAACPPFPPSSLPIHPSLSLSLFSPCRPSVCLLPFQECLFISSSSCCFLVSCHSFVCLPAGMLVV
ncbi:unnamed protein product, partial [Closterium sp. Naga37s-1]